MPTAPSSLDAEAGGPVGTAHRKMPDPRSDFALLTGTSAVSQLGSMSVAAAGPLLALALTGSPVAAGYVTAASVLPGLLLHVPAGALADRVDRRKVMWASQLMRIAFAVITCSALALQCDPVAVLVLAALVDGACSVFYEIAEIATVPDLVSKKSLNLAIGSNEAKLNASMLLGRPLGGALLAVHPVMPWLLTACTSFFPVGALVVMRRRSLRRGARKPAADAPPDDPPGAPPEKPPTTDVPADAPDEKPPTADAAGTPDDGLALRVARKRLLRDPFSRVVLAVCVLANLFFQVIVLQQILLAEQRDMPSYLVGLLLAFSGLGGLVGAVGSPWLLRGRPPSASVALCVLAWVPLVWLATAWESPTVGLLMWGMCSAIGAHINVALRAHQAMTFPGALLGRVTGITRFLSVGSVALGAFSGGWLIKGLGIHGTTVLVNVAFVAIALILVLVLYFPAMRTSARRVLREVRSPAGLSAEMAFICTTLALWGAFALPRLAVHSFVELWDSAGRSLREVRDMLGVLAILVAFRASFHTLDSVLAVIWAILLAGCCLILLSPFVPGGRRQVRSRVRATWKNLCDLAASLRKSVQRSMQDGSGRVRRPGGETFRPADRMASGPSEDGAASEPVVDRMASGALEDHGLNAIGEPELLMQSVGSLGERDALVRSASPS